MMGAIAKPYSIIYIKRAVADAMDKTRLHGFFELADRSHSLTCK